MWNFWIAYNDDCRKYVIFRNVRSWEVTKKFGYILYCSLYIANERVEWYIFLWCLKIVIFIWVECCHSAIRSWFKSFWLLPSEGFWCAFPFSLLISSCWHSLCSSSYNLLKDPKQQKNSVISLRNKLLRYNYLNFSWSRDWHFEVMLVGKKHKFSFGWGCGALSKMNITLLSLYRSSHWKFFITMPSAIRQKL